MRTLFPGEADDGSSAVPTARSQHKEEEREEVNNTPVEAITVAPVASKKKSPSPDPFKGIQKNKDNVIKKVCVCGGVGVRTIHVVVR